MPKQSLFPLEYFFEILNSPRVKPLAQRLHPSIVLNVLKGVFDDAYGELRAAISEQRRPSLNELLEKIVARLVYLRDVAEPLVIDARGRIIPNDFERLADVALEESAWLAAEPTSEYARRQDALREKDALARLARLGGAERAIVFPTTELARLAVLQAILDDNRALVVARRDLYERENGDRIERVFDVFPALERVEIGACNAVAIEDYERALRGRRACVWRSVGRWLVDGRSVRGDEFAKLREDGECDFETILDVEFAPIVNLSAYFDVAIPTVADRVKSGYDVVLCNGAQLIGGPLCGIVFCSREASERIAETTPGRNCKLDRVAFGALAKTLSLYDEPEKALANIPVLKMLTASIANLENRAERLAAILETLDCVESARVAQGRAFLCSVATLGSSPTRLVEIRPKGFSAAEFAAKLERESSPSLLVKWTRDSVFIDLKTLAPEQDLVVSELMERFDDMLKNELAQ